MAKTVNEVFQQLESGRQELAVWNEVVAFLSRFVDTETREADQGIETKECVSRTVPQEVIQAVRTYIESQHIEPLMAEILELSNQQLAETTNDEKKSEKSQEAGRERKVPRPKAPRVVSRRVGGAGQQTG
jgi:hypothetical protein